MHQYATEFALSADIQAPADIFPLIQLVTTTLGSFSAAAVLGTADAVLPEAFTFAATTVPYVRMDILNVHGNCCISFGEVAFEQVAGVPEPATFALIGLGLAGLEFSKRRKV